MRFEPKFREETRPRTNKGWM